MDYPRVCPADAEIERHVARIADEFRVGFETLRLPEEQALNPYCDSLGRT